MTTIKFKYKGTELILNTNKTILSEIKKEFHHKIYQKFYLLYTQYELFHNNIQIKENKTIYLTIDTLYLDIKEVSTMDIMSSILNSKKGNINNNCILCNFPTKNLTICSFCSS